MSDPATREGPVAEAVRLLNPANAMPVPVPAGGEVYGPEGIEVLRGLPGKRDEPLYPCTEHPGAEIRACYGMPIIPRLGVSRTQPLLDICPGA